MVRPRGLSSLLQQDRLSSLLEMFSRCHVKGISVYRLLKHIQVRVAVSTPAASNIGLVFGQVPVLYRSIIYSVLLGALG